MKSGVAVFLTLTALNAAERPASKLRLESLLKSTANRTSLSKTNKTFQTPADDYEYTKAPDILVQGEINRSRAEEARQTNALNESDVELLAKWQNKMAQLRMENSKRLVDEMVLSKAEEDALEKSVNAATSDFRKAYEEGLQETAGAAEAERGSMQSMIFRMANGLARIDCPPPAADYRGLDPPRADGLPLLGWSDGIELVGAELQLEPLLNNRRFDTFEEAWRLCGETEGCGQVLFQEVKGSVTKSDGTDALIDEALELGMTGYFLRRRLDTAKAVGYAFDLRLYKEHVWANEGVNTSDSDPPRTEYSATEYKCMALCPSACMSFKNEVQCNECAAVHNKDCTICDPNTKAGCSGNCPLMMMDCRACFA